MTKIIGSFEPVTFPDFANIGKVVAKIDTGAHSGALHCTKIHEEEGTDGPVLHFSPFDHPEVEITATEFAVRHVWSSMGKRERRYFVDTTIIIQGETYPIMLSLADRSDMTYPVLIGRRFLDENQFLVDVKRGAEYREQGNGRL